LQQRVRGDVTVSVPTIVAGVLTPHPVLAV
jgi:hypothetical protein